MARHHLMIGLGILLLVVAATMTQVTGRRASEDTAPAGTVQLREPDRVAESRVVCDLHAGGTVTRYSVDDCGQQPPTAQAIDGTMASFLSFVTVVTVRTPEGREYTVELAPAFPPRVFEAGSRWPPLPPVLKDTRGR